MYQSREDRKYGISKLNSSNYFAWKQQMEMILVKEELWDVIETPTPDNPDDNWTRKNKLAMATIGLMVSDKNLIHIKHENTATGIWHKLERIHQTDNIGTRLMLYRKLFSTKYTIGENMDDHLTNIMITAEQLQDRGFPVPKEILCAVLMGSLTKEYNPMITAIEGRNSDDINIEYVRAKIMEEASRQKHTNVEHNMALHTEETRNPRRYTNSVQCYYCRKIGHIRKDCRILKKHEAHKPMQGSRTPGKKKMNYHNQHQTKVTTGQDNDSSPETSDRSTVKLTSTNPIQRAMTMSNYEPILKTNRWILDTGAGSHMCNNLQELMDIDEIQNPVSIVTASGQSHQADQKGNYVLKIKDNQGRTTEILLKDVLYAPQLTDNLISISRLDQEGMEIIFKQKKCWIVHNKIEYTVGELKDSLYVYTPSKTTSHAKICQHVWHQRLGHRDIKSIKRTQQFTQPEDLNISKCDIDKLCEVCQTTKKHQESFEPIKNRTPDKPFHTLHTDLCGPIVPQSMGGNKYILSIIDDYSRFTKIYAIPHKHQATDRIKQFIEEGINLFNRRPLILRTDGGGEFQNNNLNNFLAQKGIKHQLSLPYMHQQNGLIERYNRTLMEGTRALLKEAKLPDNLWAEMANTSTYINNLIIKSDKQKTPFELWYNRPPRYGHLRTIGSKCYFINSNPHKSKLQDRGTPGILLGYGASKQFYRILNLTNNTVQETRGVTFEEENCPYQTMTFISEHSDNDKIQPEPEIMEPETEDTVPELRKSQRTNQGRPPQSLTYDEDGKPCNSQKDWYENHKTKGQLPNT